MSLRKEVANIKHACSANLETVLPLYMIVYNMTLLNGSVFAVPGVRSRSFVLFFEWRGKTILCYERPYLAPYLVCLWCIHEQFKVKYQ